MIKFEHTEVTGWKHAIRGMRNPMNSWEQSDSCECNTLKLEAGADCEMVFNDHEPCHECNNGEYGFCVGEKDYDLMTRLRNAGTDHRKFMRMIAVYADITAPLYWWKEFDTYKVGTVANSCSTMHKIHAKEFTYDDFSHEHLSYIDIGRGMLVSPMNWLKTTISMLNGLRSLYLQTNSKEYWWQMIQLLPTSYNQKRTVMLNYEVLANIYKSRKNHKLDEWRDLCRWIETLPYSELITRKGERNENKENDTGGESS